LLVVFLRRLSKKPWPFISFLLRLFDRDMLTFYLEQPDAGPMFIWLLLTIYCRVEIFGQLDATIG
jgi:hypothetical protein